MCCCFIRISDLSQCLNLSHYTPAPPPFTRTTTTTTPRPTTRRPTRPTTPYQGNLCRNVGFHWTFCACNKQVQCRCMCVCMCKFWILIDVLCLPWKSYCVWMQTHFVPLCSLPNCSLGVFLHCSVNLSRIFCIEKLLVHVAAIFPCLGWISVWMVNVICLTPFFNTKTNEILIG